MKKVICRECGLVNLDKFTAFPHCAACGARLPEIPSRVGSFWTRPVRPILWVSVVGVGVAILAAGILDVVRETRASGDDVLIATLQLPKRARVGETVVARLTLDSHADSSAKLRAVRLRWSRETESDFRFAGVAPPPDIEERVGSGRYFGWDELARGQAIRFQIVPRRAGALRLRLGIYSRDHARAEARGSVRVGR